MRQTLRQMRWQIAGTYTLLILLTLGGLAALLYALTWNAYRTTLETGVAGQARLVAILAKAVPAEAGDTHLAPLIVDLGRQIRARITLIDADGQILADSLLPPERYTNQGDRPEVQAALSGALGETARYSTATGDDRFYIAVPLQQVGAPPGVVRIGVPLATIATAQLQLGLAVFLAALLAASIAVAIAMRIARRTTAPLRELGGMAQRLAAGDLDVRVPVPHGIEVADLAQSFNQMASQLRQLIDARAREGARLATILATMDDGILILDREQRVTLANRAATQALALTSPPPVPLSQIAGSAPIADVAQTVGQTRDATLTTIEEVIPPVTGRSLRVLVTRLDDAATAQVLVVLQDLTAVRHAERSRRLLLANITHDLRTPLASLQALLDTLADGAIDEPAVARDFLARMDTEVHGLRRLVDEFLELSAIELGQITLHRVPTQVPALLQQVVDRMTAQAQQKQIRLALVSADSLPLVSLDARRMEQVLLNLLQNAIAATPSGGQISVSAQAEAQRLIIRVRDSGGGIAPEDLPHIFERFYKADPARSGGGVGLGLAIAKHLVERHAGRIWAESTPGVGTTISIALPIDLPAAR